MSQLLVVVLLLMQAPSGAATDSFVSTTPRAVFLRGLDAMEGSSKKTFVADLSSFIATELERAPEKQTREASLKQRRNLVLGLSALFDATDLLLSNPFSRPFYTDIVQGDDEHRRRRHLGGWVRFHGRNDAVAHFFLSAALTALTGPVLAERLGHNKEVADAKRLEEDGEGDGFSFPDLAYNQAGIRFSCWMIAWGDESKLGRQPPPLQDFLPDFDELDLPEKLAWSEFNDKYWGKNVAEFDALIDKIRKALDDSLR